jgi:hypothetical protein
LNWPKKSIFTAGVCWETPLNTSFGISNTGLYNKYSGRYLWEGEGEWRRWRWRTVVDGLHRQIGNRRMKPFAIALSGMGRRWQGGRERMEEDLTNVHCKAIQNRHNNPPVQWIYANKMEEIIIIMRTDSSTEKKKTPKCILHTQKKTEPR